MIPTKYVECRFIGSQIAMDRKKSTDGLALNQAVRAWMAVLLFFATVYHFCAVFVAYIGVLFNVISRPAHAQRQVDEYQAEKQRDVEFAKNLAAKLSKEMLQGATKQRAEAGLDDPTKSGNA